MKPIVNVILQNNEIININFDKVIGMLVKEVVYFVNKSPHKNPDFSDIGSSGFDLRAWLNQDNGGEWNEEKEQYICTLKPLERKLIHTGLYFELPNYGEIQVRPRSGLALKQGLTVLNTPGTVDASYTGEVCVILVNLSNETTYITDGDRIAQGVFCYALNGYCVKLEVVDEIKKQTNRGDSGFGHSGLK